MADQRLRNRERAFHTNPGDETRLALLEEEIRAGLVPEPDRTRTLIAKSAIRCWLHTNWTTGPRGVTLALEVPLTEILPRPFPELGAQYVFVMDYQAVFQAGRAGHTVDLVTFDDAESGVQLSTKPITGIALAAGYELRFVFNLGWTPPAPPCELCGAVNECATCGEPSMIVMRCAEGYCRSPDGPPPICGDCYVKQAEAEGAANG